METDSNITKLKELTKHITENGTLHFTNDNEITEYEVKNGTAFALSLMNQPKVAVCRVFMSKGTIVPKHNHEVNELGMVYSGKFKVTSNGDERIVDVGQYCYFPVELFHSIECLEDSWSIWITIPADPSFPPEIVPNTKKQIGNNL